MMKKVAVAFIALVLAVIGVLRVDKTFSDRQTNTLEAATKTRDLGLRANARAFSGDVQAVVTRTSVSDHAHPQWLASSASSLWTEHFAKLGLGPAHEIDVCGLGRVKVAMLHDNVVEPSEAALVDAFSRIVNALKKSSYEVDRTLAVVLSMQFEFDDVFEKNNAAGISQLTAIARETKEPLVYAMALRECQAMTVPDAGCNFLSAAGWAALDQDNLIPAFAAAQARSDKNISAPTDSPEVLNELYRLASEKPIYDERRTPLSRVFSLPDFGQLEPHVQKALATRLTGIAAARHGKHILQFNQYCSKPQIQAFPTRRGVCDVFVQRMASSDTGLFSLVVSSQIGKEIGWSEDKVAALKNNFEAMSEAAWHYQPVDNPLSCSEIRNNIAASKFYLDHGERAAYQEKIRLTKPVGHDRLE